MTTKRELEVIRADLESDLCKARARIEELEKTNSDLDSAIADLPCWRPGANFATLDDARLLLNTWYDTRNVLRRLVDRAEEDGDKPRYMYLRGSLAEKVTTIVHSYDCERAAAIETFGAFQEHVLISLQAMLMIAKQTYSMTHRQKDARLDVLCDTIQETINNIAGDKIREWHSFDRAPFSVKNWDVRQLAATKFRLERDVKQHEHLVELVRRYNPELLEQWQASTKQPKRDTLPF